MQEFNTEFADFIRNSLAAMVAGAGSVFGIQKAVKTWKGSSAELGLIKTMHEELLRLGQYNKTLSEELGKIQNDFLKLNREMRELSDENQNLHSEIHTLTLEVKRLRGLIKAQKEAHGNKSD